MTAKSKKRQHKRKPSSEWRWGSVADARALGVSYQHLWHVLEGNRQSRSLMARYRALKESQKKTS